MINKTLVICEVDNCKYNNSHNCSLNTLKISFLSNEHNCTKKSETICKSLAQKIEKNANTFGINILHIYIYFIIFFFF